MFGAYSVAVRVSLINDVSTGLLGIGRHFRGAEQDARSFRLELAALQQHLRVIKLMGAAGLGMGVVGGLGLAALGKTLDPAREYAHQLALINTAGMKHAEVVKSINAAWSLNRAVPTSTSTANLEAIRELRTVFGDTQEAINFLPSAQRMAYILQNSRGATPEGAKGEVMAAGRALDRRNATTDLATANTQADLMLKAIVASGGVLSAKDFASTFLYGRSATLGWSNEFAYKILPSLMQEFKAGTGSGAGGGPGNPLMSAYNAVVQGTVPQKALAEWQKLGLLDSSKVVWNQVGDAKGLRPGAIVGSDMFISDPYQWTQRVLKPALVRAGADTEKEQRQLMGHLFPNRTAGAVMGTMLFQSRAIERDRKMFGIAEGMDAYQTLMKNDPMAAQAALAAQWNNLLTVIGFEILPIVVKGTLALVDGLRGLAEVMRRHPIATKALVVGFAALSAALLFSGVVFTMVAAWKALQLVMGFSGTVRLMATAMGAMRTAVVGGALVNGITGVSTALAGMGAIGLLGIAAGIVAVVTALGFGAAELMKNQGGNFARPYTDPKTGETGTITSMGVWVPHRKDTLPGVKALGMRSLNFDPKTGRSVAVPAGASRPKTNMQGDVHMDGRKVGQVVWRHQNAATERASRQSVPGIDPGMALAPVAGRYRS